MKVNKKGLDYRLMLWDFLTLIERRFRDQVPPDLLEEVTLLREFLRTEPKRTKPKKK